MNKTIGMCFMPEKPKGKTMAEKARIWTNFATNALAMAIVGALTGYLVYQGHDTTAIMYAAGGLFAVFLGKVGLTKAAPIIILSVLVFSVGCASQNQTVGKDGSVVNASPASASYMDNDGVQSASYLGVAPTTLKQDAEGTWLNTPGMGGIITYDPATGKLYLWSPKDSVLVDVAFTPQPEAGQPSFTAARIEMNISAPASVYADQFVYAMQAIQGMTEAEAERRLGEMVAAGQITADVAAAVVAVFGGMFTP